MEQMNEIGGALPSAAKIAGYHERFAQEASGHNSKAVHRAYAKKALMKIPPFQEYEERAGMQTKVTA